MAREKKEPLQMDTVLEQFVDQIRTGYALTEKVSVGSKIDRIVVAGMGGSALPGEILQSYLPNLPIPIIVVKDYKIPAFFDSSTLFFSVSYSGNTEEALETCKEAWRKGCKIIVLASGGKLIDLAKEKSVPHVYIPEGVQPRLAYGYLFFAILRILENSKLVEKQAEEIEATMRVMKKTELLKQKAEDFVPKVLEKIPLIYTPRSLRGVGYKWKINFNETAKKQAFCNEFPEMDHNELMGFMDEKKDFFVFIIKDEADVRVMNKRIETTKELIKQQGIGLAEISLTGPSRLAKIFSALAIGDWLSYLVAVEKGIDPNEVVLIESLKKKLG